MALASQNVRVAVTGAISVGPTGTTAPTAATGAVAGMVDLGYVSEDGVTETRDRTSETTRAWQNGDIVRETVTEANLTFSCTLIETKEETVELYYGNAVDPATGSLIIVPSKTGGRRAMLIDVVDGDQAIRIWVPQAEVTEVGDQVYANGEPIGYEVTIRAYPDASLVDADGNTGSARKFFSSLVVA